MSAFTVTLPSCVEWTPSFVASIDQDKYIGCGRGFKVCGRQAQPRGVDEDGALVDAEEDEYGKKVMPDHGGQRSGRTVVAIVTTDRAVKRPVREAGLEPARPKAQEPKSCVAASYTTPARPGVDGPGADGLDQWSRPARGTDRPDPRRPVPGARTSRLLTVQASALTIPAASHLRDHVR